MTKSTITWMKWLFGAVAFASMVGLAFLVAAPTGPVHAAELPQGGVADACKSCHADLYEHWVSSKHGMEETNCFACHKLGTGEGAHPQVSYLVLPEAETCDVCHVDIKNEWVSSRHGERGMGCITCHEPHSQQQKLIDDNKTTCENCHRTQVNATHGSTHGAAGVDCASCHLGPKVGHTFISEISTCQSCHSDIHEANSLIRGVSITPVAPAIKPRASAEAEKPERGGINLPVWLFFVVGIGLGGGGVWVLIERELDVAAKPEPEDEDSQENQA
ncbi:MAG: cytochrome c3 family protein [Anaerolineales bacterium]|jgi:hypothetical protein|nr:cytochrome c3 family protein [Anaerolineales bacterium]